MNEAAQQREFKVAWRYACGLGADHPSENGFTFEPLTGLPLIRATALKGLCRRGALLSGVTKDELERLFGSDYAFPTPSGPMSIDDPNSNRRRGDIVFLDAYPTEWPRLEVDIVNCHYPGYYRAQHQGESPFGDNRPMEVDSPVPVYFMTVAAGNAFSVRLFSRQGNAGDAGQAMQWLSLALDFLGAGAKTAVGYGQMLYESEGLLWLEETIAGLAAKNGQLPEAVLEGRALAKTWDELPPGPLKTEARNEIERRWREHGWWERPLTNGQKKALKIYHGNS